MMDPSVLYRPTILVLLLSLSITNAIAATNNQTPAFVQAEVDRNTIEISGDQLSNEAVTRLMSDSVKISSPLDDTTLEGIGGAT